MTLQCSLSKDLFAHSSVEEYWHYIARQKTSPNFFEKYATALAEKIRQLGRNSLNRQAAVTKWTPLHVAILSKNPFAIRFFIQNKARVDLPDWKGNTFLDLYQSQLKQSVLELAKELWAPMIESAKEIGGDVDPFDPKLQLDEFSPQFCSFDSTRSFIRRILPPPMSLPRGDFTYSATTNDWGTELRKLLFCRQPANLSELPARTEYIIQGMHRVAQEEGFDITTTAYTYYPRDQFIKHPSGKNLVLGFSPIQDSPSIRQSIACGCSKTAWFGEGAAYQTRLQCFPGRMGPSLEMKPYALQDRRLLGSSLSSTSLYIEGGNLLTVTNSKGERKVLIGEMHRAQLHVQMRLEGMFEEGCPAHYGQDTPDDLVKKTAEEMYAMGLISIGAENQTGFLSFEKANESTIAFYYAQDKSLSFRDVAIKKGFIKEVNWTPALVEEVRPAVRNYLFQKDEQLVHLSSVLGVSPNDILFVPNIFYHLDVGIKSGPKGSLFVQDFSACRQILEVIQENFVPLGLSSRESRMVARYLDTARILEEKLGSSCLQTKDLLEKAGFIVIPTPGLFIDQDYAPGVRTYHLNFLNSISGWSEKNRRDFFITTGIQVGERLSPLLMELFAQFLKQYSPNVEVHFVGENPAKRGDFSQAMELWNQLQKNGQFVRGILAGIHCLSYELAAENHRVS